MIPLDKDHLILVSVGQLDDNKNQKLLLEAIAVLKRRNLACSVLLLGRGAERENLERASHDLGIAELVYFAGYQQNPYPFIKAADIMCVTSFSEGFPTVVLEAMTLGKPFITTPVSGSSDELVCGGLCGLIAGWDVQEWANAIEKLAFDSNLYESMSSACLREAKKYSVDSAVQNFDSLIESVMNKEFPVHKCTQIKETSRFSAVVRFAYAWAFKRYSGLEVASVRFIREKTVINGVKVLYRILLGSFNFVMSPFRFISGLFLGYLRGARK
jgi:glycogen synthase